MSETDGSPAGARSLPEKPNLDWLRKQAKRRLDELRTHDPSAQLADAQFDVAKRFGFSSWRALKSHIDSLTVAGQLFDAAAAGDVDLLTALLDAHPDLIGVRNQPYEWSLLHVAAHRGHLDLVNVLLARGFDVNTKERGDRTYAMHWAAAAGHVNVVRRLADAGGDVIGRGDDHELEVIGWATCWDGCDDAAHREVVSVLLEHGARHHIFSAVAIGDANEVQRIVRDDPLQLNRRMSRHENRQTPLQFAVRKQLPAMVSLLLTLGADPLATDQDGLSATWYAVDPTTDRALMEALHAMTLVELDSADRGQRPAGGKATDLLASLALGDEATAARLVRDAPESLREGGALHLAARRGDVAMVRWLLGHGAEPNGMWAMWDAQVTALHPAALLGHAEVVRARLDGGADPSIRDSKHDGDALGWAEHGGQPEIAKMLRA